jgi:predicted glycosyltransferase
MVEPAALTPEHLMTEVRRALDAPMPQASSIDMEGLSRVRNRVQRLLEGRTS